MVRVIICMFAALLLAGLPAQAGDFTDKNNTFRLTVPEGWTVQTPPPQLAVVVTSPRVADTGGNCNALTGAEEGTRTMSQAEVEADVGKHITPEFWKTSIMANKMFKSTTVEASGDKVQRGRKVFFVKTRSDVELNGVAFKVVQLANLHVIPGRFYLSTCTVEAVALDQESADFETVLTSFEPIPEATVASLSNRAPVTLSHNHQARAHAVIGGTARAFEMGAVGARPR
jgi:hypothetical protein